MPLGDVRSVHLPYCIERQSDGTYVVLNREHKPLGFKTGRHLDYAAYPISVKLRGLGAVTTAKISYNGSSDLSRIYLYNDGCIPTRSSTHMAAYLKRLAQFAKLKVD